MKNGYEYARQNMLREHRSRVTHRILLLERKMSEQPNWLASDLEQVFLYNGQLDLINSMLGVGQHRNL